MTVQHRLWAVLAIVFVAGVAGAYSPPIGIPVPPFGIDETHMIYVGKTYNFGSGPVPYPDAGHGPYTHYVDPTIAASTDTSNPYGTPAKPRKTVPTRLAAGSVVEIHTDLFTGDPNNASDAYNVVGGNEIRSSGTPDAPVFIRGVSVDSRPVIRMSTKIQGTYAIIENLNLLNTAFDVDSDVVPTHHIGIRYNEMHGIPWLNHADAIVPSVNTDYTVIFRNTIHDNGWSPTPDQENDAAGVCMAVGSGYTWILENEIYHQGGDGVAATSPGTIPFDTAAHNIYVGRNKLHDNSENGLDFKCCIDVVISENEMYNFVTTHFPNSGSDGAAMVIHYQPDRVWLIANKIHDACFGIRCNGAEHVWMLNNVIYRIYHDPNQTDWVPTYGAGPGAGIICWATPHLYCLNNTIFDCDHGFLAYQGGAPQYYYLSNNLISDIHTDSYHISVNNQYASSNMPYNLMWDQNGMRVTWHGLCTSLAALQAAFPAQTPHCIVGDPMFADAANLDLTLQSTSPGVDTADTSVYQTAADYFKSLYGVDINVDYAGKPRITGAAIDMGAFETSGPANRCVFYKGSVFGGASDDAAIATDKTPLLSGHTATFANYTSYVHGITGMMIDLPNVSEALSAADFEFHVGNDSNPAAWPVLATAPTVAVRQNAGVGGYDRVVLTWPDNTIVGKWLQVKVLANAATGLTSANVFYFGSAPGDTGNSTSDAQVTPADEVAVRNDPHTAGVNPAAVNDPCDFDRDGRVGPSDAVIARNNGTNSGTALQLIAVP